MWFLKRVMRAGLQLTEQRLLRTLFSLFKEVPFDREQFWTVGLFPTCGRGLQYLRTKVEKKIWLEFYILKYRICSSNFSLLVEGFTQQGVDYWGLLSWEVLKKWRNFGSVDKFMGRNNCLSSRSPSAYYELEGPWFCPGSDLSSK